MDFIRNLFIKYHLGWLVGLLSLVSFNFVGNLCLALSDGKIDPTEFHSLSASANGIEMLILIVLMSVFRTK